MLMEQIMHGRIYREITGLRNVARTFVEEYHAQWILEKSGNLSAIQVRLAWDVEVPPKPAA